MATVKIALNPKFNYNYCFFDPTTMLTLNLGNPVGFASRLSPKIIRGLKSKTIIVVDGKVDLEKGIIIDPSVTGNESIEGKVAVPKPEEPKKESATEEKPEDTEVVGNEDLEEDKKTEAPITTTKKKANNNRRRK
jgi:hypothetical protein